MPNVLTRKSAELAAKLTSLSNETEAWRQRSEGGQALEKHHSQIRRVTRQIDSASGIILKRLDALKADGADVLVAARRIELQILELHRIWHYFRGKLIQRHVPGFDDYLAVADELAWHCYEQARNASARVAKEPGYAKEPPLVFFNGGDSPFIVTRRLSWNAEPVGRSAIETAEFIELLHKLPVPVLGVPWFQVAHLPDMLVIGHEVGHCVEADFELTERLEALVDEAAPGKYLAGWRHWVGEVFADVYGALALGPAFGGTMLDFLLDNPAYLRNEQPVPDDWHDHPPTALRIAVVAAVLKQIGMVAESATLLDEWSATVGKTALHDKAHLDDVGAVVEKIIAGPYPQFGGRTLDDVVSFSNDENEQAVGDADKFLTKFMPKSGSAAVLLCAARLAFAKDADTYANNGIARRAIDRVLELRADGVRDTAEFRDNRKKVDKFDAVRGSELLAILDARIPC